LIKKRNSTTSVGKGIESEIVEQLPGRQKPRGYVRAVRPRKCINANKKKGSAQERKKVIKRTNLADGGGRGRSRMVNADKGRDKEGLRQSAGMKGTVYEKKKGKHDQ